MAPRREHSRKPDEFYMLVEGLCPGSKVELFAREKREGWQAWGGEDRMFCADDKMLEYNREENACFENPTDRGEAA